MKKYCVYVSDVLLGAYTSSVDAMALLNALFSLKVSGMLSGDISFKECDI